MQRVWMVFLALTSLIAMVFLVKTSLKLQEYFSLNQITKAFVTDWKISEKDETSFALQVFYEFSLSGKDKIQSQMELAKPYFLNRPSAEKAVEEFSKQSWEVFYNDKNPNNNSLQKLFPFKDCIQTLLTLGIFVYFIFFRKILEKARQEW